MDDEQKKEIEIQAKINRIREYGYGEVTIRIVSGQIVSIEASDVVVWPVKKFDKIK